MFYKNILLYSIYRRLCNYISVSILGVFILSLFCQAVTVVVFFTWPAPLYTSTSLRNLFFYRKKAFLSIVSPGHRLS